MNLINFPLSVSKLCKIEKQRRIEIYKALSHPWITRSAKSQIPLTIIESCMKKELINKFKIVTTKNKIDAISSSVFLQFQGSF